MESQQHLILNGDCFDLIKNLSSNSVDLVITSPPYADIVNYGNNISIKNPDDYVAWLLPIFDEIYRILKPTGSFILNINDKCVDGHRSKFIFDLISRNKSKLKMYDYYIWYKKCGIPNGGNKRFRNMTEWIFHFTKNAKQMKFYMDRVLQNPSKGYLDRMEYRVTDYQCVVEDGFRKNNKLKISLKNQKSNSGDRVVSDMVRPENVFRFNSASASRENSIKHPAPYHKDLPSYFINLLTDENDLVVDIFSGIGTTSIACKELKRNSIGFELNDKYVEFSIERLKK